MSYLITIDRARTYRVLDMPGLRSIDFPPETPRSAQLRFETAEGCQPAGLEFVMGEVFRVAQCAVAGQEIDR